MDFLDDERSLPPIGKKRLFKLIEMYGMWCHWCGCELVLSSGKHPVPDNTATVDHIIPKCKGGKDVFNNVVLACDLCNQIRKKKIGFYLTTQETKVYDRPSTLRRLPRSQR